MSGKKKIINRDLSWLSFNERVLQEAIDETVPLVERMRFLGIYSNNLDEFFKVRVATLKRMIDYAYNPKELSGEKPAKILAQIQEKVLVQQQKFSQAFDNIINEFEKENIYFINEQQLNEEQAYFVDNYFDTNILPFLSPIMLSNVENFPEMKDKSIYFAIKLSNSKRKVKTEYVLMEIPSILNRVVRLPSDGNRQCIILIDDIIRFCLKDLFAIFSFDKFEAYTIKLTRDAELDIDNDLSKSLVEMISQGVSSRSHGQPVRFVYDQNIPNDLLKYIINKLKFDNTDTIIPGARYHNFKDFITFPNIGEKRLEYPSTPAVEHPQIDKHASIIETIMHKDVMLHYPYQKFDRFVDFLREASMDPKVKSVKITLYRLSKNSKVVNALINAARNGKDVTAVIELQARFDEKSNIYWTRKLEEAGVNVMFGIKGLKIHAKLVLITRQEGKILKSYAAVCTGNFHEGNAAVYTDVALLTSDKRITNEVARVFQYFDSPYWNYSYRHLLVSPLYMRSGLIKLIDNEIKNAKAGKDAYIILKINNLVDSDMVKKLYQANNAGVRIKLIVRGICCLTPGIEGLSENIDAISIVDKFLEHSRVFVFCNNNDEKYYISSADWMTRNLDHRVEVACPIYDEEIKKEIWMKLEVQLSDNTKARILNEAQDNQYVRNDAPPIRAQFVLYDYYKNKAKS
ncbi:MAG TPA: polyphosphate kinase 1 [Bacteroidales bacterium]|nr:polyphosphate kinase 1 [Bacteroidales bacterium]